MRVRDARRLARRLMVEHGVGHWHLELVHTSAYAGRCDRGPQIIELSEPFVRLNRTGPVTEVVLHEIAHARTVGAHDYSWRKEAKRIGCTGSAHPRYTVEGEWIHYPAEKWIALCPSCRTFRVGATRAEIGHVCVECSRKGEGLAVLAAKEITPRNTMDVVEWVRQVAKEHSKEHSLDTTSVRVVGS